MRRALIVGAGVSGFLHALALRSAGIAIGAVFDPDIERAALLASVVGGRPCDSFEEAKQIDAEIAAVCSPPIHHVEQAEALARSGRLVFVEKPVALSRDELERLRRAPNVVPVLQWRAGRAARELRAAMRSGAFGDSVHVRCDLRLWRDDAYFEGGRRGRERWGCGAMLSIGIHAVDLVLWIVGRRVVGASGEQRLGRLRVDVATESEMTVWFEGGARADIRVTVDAEGLNDVRLAVRGKSTSALLFAGEGDPTGTPLVLRGVAPSAVSGAGGALGSPLLVPFIREAISRFDARRSLLSVDDVADGHELAFAVEASGATSAASRVNTSNVEGLERGPTEGNISS
jgi:predicted dehydrogenase